MAPPIGIMDSGVGGFSILREVHRLLPHRDVIYLADQAHVPYGPRPTVDIRRFVEGITRFFQRHEAEVVVIACNAASAAALHHVRRVFPSMPFVGMEPAVKPAALNTRTGVIGVITTKATYQGELFASVIDRFAKGVRVEAQVCPAFVTLVEKGQLTGPEAEGVARDYLAPLIEKDIDQLVLGCTHFPFLTPVLQTVLGPDITIIDPSEAVARQVMRVLGEESPQPGVYVGSTHYVTSGDPIAFRKRIAQLMGHPPSVRQVAWQGEDLSYITSL